MLLKSFKVKNFKSIIDSNLCWLTEKDNISILAGQNESGKSSILQALVCFDKEEITQEDIRDGDDVQYPEITCNFSIDKSDISHILESLSGIDCSEVLVEKLKGCKEVSITKIFSSLSDSEISLNGELSKDKVIEEIRKIDDLAQKQREKISEYKSTKDLYNGCESKKSKIQQEISKAKQNISSITKKLSGENLSPEKQVDLNNHLADENEELDELSNSLSELQNEFKDLEKRLKSLSKDKDIVNYNKYCESIEPLHKNIKDLESDLSSIRTEIEGILISDEEDEEIDEDTEAEIEQLRKKENITKEKLIKIKEESKQQEKDGRKRYKIHEELSEDIKNEIYENFVNEIYNQIPIFLFFDDFCDLLPEKIGINDLKQEKVEVRGYQAVKNIEALLETDFTNLDKMPDHRRDVKEDQYIETITADFNDSWKQRISAGSGAKIHIKYNQGREPDSAYLNFYIETKKGEYLPPNRRSQGFKWFLSFYLHLKAESKRSESFTLLFDEPGLYLHSKAQEDMLAVFKDLSEKNRIIYSTHSPSLIDPSKLYRIRLVYNVKEHGTTIEKITTIKSPMQRDALKPVIDAMGISAANSELPFVKKNNVILEGISDFYYFQAFRVLLGIDSDFAFLPSMGMSNSHLLMELCIGWGLDWLIIFDEKGAKQEMEKIKQFFPGEGLEEKVFTLGGCDGIEDAFLGSDLELAREDVSFPDSKKNSETVKNYGGKELYARLFLERVSEGHIKASDISSETTQHFTEAFNFIHEKFNLD